MRELQSGLWHWAAPHPEWTPNDGGPEGWPQEVSSYAVDTGECFVVFDPVAPPSLVDELASGRDPVVVLTCRWHERDSASVVERLGAPVYSPPQAGAEGAVTPRDYEPGDELPGGVVAQAAVEAADLVLWIPGHRALVFGDTLIDRGNGLEIPATWAPEGVTLEQRAAALRPLLDLPVLHVLPTHGPPTDRAALERALA
jgi:glyoxylase-like metal-dependent hydrolase (beta-lactamase superfamily II)